MTEKKQTFEQDRRNGRQLMAVGGAVIAITLACWAVATMTEAYNWPWPVQAGMIAGIFFVCGGFAQSTFPRPDPEDKPPAPEVQS